MSDNEIIKKLSEPNDRLDKLLTRDDFVKIKNEIFQKQSQILSILIRLDHNRVFSVME